MKDGGSEELKEFQGGWDTGREKGEGNSETGGAREGQVPQDSMKHHWSLDFTLGATGRLSGCLLQRDERHDQRNEQEGEGQE